MKTTGLTFAEVENILAVGVFKYFCYCSGGITGYIRYIDDGVVWNAELNIRGVTLVDYRNTNRSCTNEPNWEVRKYKTVLKTYYGNLMD